MVDSPTIKLLSDDVELESQRVRSMYEPVTNYDWEAGTSPAAANSRNIEEILASNERPL